MDHRDWPGKQRLAEHQACSCTRLQHFSQTVEPFWRLILSIFSFFNECFLFQNGTLLCRQNRIFVVMSYFLKIAVLSPILSTKRSSTTALLWTKPKIFNARVHGCFTKDKPHIQWIKDNFVKWHYHTRWHKSVKGDVSSAILKINVL